MILNKKILHLSLVHFVRSFLLKPFYTLNLVSPKPIQVTLGITLSCNARCKQCDIWKINRNKKRELSAEEWKKIIVKLKAWLGTYYLCFVGGEVTLRKDLPELIKFSSDLGLPTAVGTNLLLKDKNQLLKIINSWPDRIIVSLDGISPTTHDYIRGRKGAFNTVMRNINFIKKKNKKLRIKISTIIFKNNLDEIEELIKWVYDNGLDEITFQPLVYSYNFPEKWNSNWYRKNPLWPDNKNKIKRTINKIIHMKKEGYRIANSIKQLKLMKEYFLNPNNELDNIECACYKNLIILPRGRIILCNSISIGSRENILTDDIGRLWNHKSKNLVKKIKKCKEPCILLNCNFEDGIKTNIEKFFRY